MAYLGFWDDLDKSTLSAGTYYVSDETGETWDSDHDLEGSYEYYDPESGEYYSSQNEADDAGADPDTLEQREVDQGTFSEYEIEPYYVNRQGISYGNEFYSINISHVFESIPADMLSGANGMSSYETVGTLKEAQQLAKSWAKKWSKQTHMVITIDNSSADAGGDILGYYLNGEEIDEDAAYDWLDSQDDDGGDSE